MVTRCEPPIRPTVPDCYGLTLLIQMIAEAQREANYCVREDDRRQILAKRNALDEFRMRLQQGKFDPAWARKVIRLAFITSPTTRYPDES